MISVIVPAFNAQATLTACLEALLCQEALAERCEILVVDDGSTDETAAIARRHPVRLLRQPHRGAAAARDLGAEAARGRILLFTDADCRPWPGWAAAMLAPFEDPLVAGVKGLFRSDQRALVARLVQAEYEEKEARMLARCTVAFADTAAAGYRAEVFRAAGGFRADFGAVEDTELAFRLAAAGYRLVVAPAAVVSHRHPESWGRYARRKFRYGWWGVRAYLAFPERLADDSRTPGTMRLQLVLAPLVVLALPGAVWLGRLGPAAALAVLAYLATVIPFAGRIGRRDPAVAAAAPLLFFVRALAVDAGLFAGLLAWLAGWAPRPRVRPSALGWSADPPAGGSEGER